jgi:hypothetical protein
LAIPVILLIIVGTSDANVNGFHVSSQSTVTVHKTKNLLDVIFSTGTADNSPDPCVPSLCYMSAYLHAFRLHTKYPDQGFDADNGCNNLYSASYCYGWLKAASYFHPSEGNEIRIAQEAWDLGWIDTNRQNYNGSHIFYPCTVDSLFCTIYLQGEVQGYADRTEFNSHSPSRTSSMSRVCLAVEQFCIWYYQEHPWYSNLDEYKYVKMDHKVQLTKHMRISKS